MPAAPVRLATADATTSCSQLSAHGEVTVNAVTPRPRTETVTPTLSPARAALANHLAHLTKLSTSADNVSRPVARLREQLSAATIALSNAELVLANLDKQHSAAIAKAAREDCCSVEPVESANAEAAVQRARRSCNSIQMALAECSEDQIKANAALTAAATNFDAIALRILVEEFEARLQHWAHKRDAFHFAEIDLLGLLQAIGQYGRDLESSAPGAGLFWLQRLEKLQPPWHHLDFGHVEHGGPREVSAASSKWSAVLVRLKSDANATF
jgi:hypothetical protein